jgi:outer membrane protein assembly factor BamD (BamD/ComL family)
MPSSLTVELGMLDRARSRLTAGDPNGTLASLDAYARAFPNGGLQPEAMLLRIQALLQSGQSARAREFGALFLRQYPSSPHAMRVRSLLQSSGAEDIP